MLQMEAEPSVLNRQGHYHCHLDTVDGYGDEQVDHHIRFHDVSSRVDHYE